MKHGRSGSMEGSMLVSRTAVLAGSNIGLLT